MEITELVTWEIADSYAEEMRYINGLQNFNPTSWYRIIKLWSTNLAYTECFPIFSSWASDFAKSEAENTEEAAAFFYLDKIVEYHLSSRPTTPVTMFESPQGNSDELWREYRNHKIFESISRIWHAVSSGMVLTDDQDLEYTNLRKLHLEETSEVRELKWMNLFKFIEDETIGLDRFSKDFFHKKMDEMVISFFNAEIPTLSRFKDIFRVSVSNFSSVCIVKPDKKTDDKKS